MIKITETNLKKIINETINKYTVSENKNIFIDPSGSEPLTYDYLFKRNKDLPKEYFDPSDVLFNPSEIEIFTHKDNFFQVNEGLIKTYPTKKAIDYVCGVLTKNGYPITSDYFTVNSPNDDNTIFGHIILNVNLYYLNKEIDDILKQTFNSCCYYLAATFNRVGVDGHQCVVFQFEPKFQTNVEKNNSVRFLYHVTTENSFKKIMVQGLCPSNRTKSIFNYEGRCYFFNVFDKELFSNYMLQAKKQNRIGKNNFNKNFKIITIDREKCPDVRFFTDPNLKSKTGVFTYENIPPSAIVKADDL